jgi:hypothetical protein
MTHELQIMVLSPTAQDGLPQIYLDDGGIWRDTTAAQAVVVNTQSKMKRDIEAHLKPLMKRVGAVPPQPVQPEGVGFRDPFKTMFQDLLPIDVRQALATAATAADATPADPRPLLKIFLTPGADWIPWELLYDGKGFLGLRFAITRLPILKQATEIRGERARQVRSVYSLLANNILQDGVFSDWESTFTQYAPNANWERRFPAAAGAVFPTTTDLFDGRDADIVHVTCHGGMKDDAGDSFYWTLDNMNQEFINYRITSSMAEHSEFGARPLVFGNACASAAAQSELGVLHGFGPSFMVGGALNFVGTFAPITRTMAVEFARRFYVNLFGNGGPGLNVSQALWTTKKSFQAQGATDPSYLFYCLYGPHDTTYTPV